MSIACLQLKIRHWQKVAIKFEKAESANSLPFTRNGCLFMWVAYFCMGAYKRRCGCWNQYGCLYSWGVYDFTMEICGFNYPISIPTGILVGRIVISLIPRCLENWRERGAPGTHCSSTHKEFCNTFLQIYRDT